MKYLLLPMMLLLASCTPQQEEMALEYIDQLEAVQEIMIEVYPYFTEWEVCEINGETYEQVSFLYTDIGLGYIVDNVVTYRSDLQITYCEGVIVEGINEAR